jgi:hypothetical protein
LLRFLLTEGTVPVCRNDDTDIGFVAAEGYKNTMANGNLPLQLWRNGISEHAVERKRQDDVYIQFVI